MPRSLYLSLRNSIKLFAVVILCLAAFATVHADPVTVTGTATSVPGVIFGPSIVFNLTGQGFTANVSDDGGIDRFMHFGFWPCTIQAGSVNPCTTANAGYSSQSDLRGPFSINGQNFNASVIDSLNFQLTSPTFVIPAEFLDDGAVLITAPFSFLGSASTLIGVTIQLDGQGTVRLLLTRQTVGDITGLFFARADYIFGQTVEGVTIESVPEPATMVLLVTGLAGVAARVRQRSRRLR